MDNRPSYYAVIPASVRYCKELEMGARILYGEITALSNKNGYCFATNNYFAEIFDVDSRTIQNWLSSLRVNNFIHIEIDREGIQTTRKIYVILPENQNIFTERKNLHGTPCKKFLKVDEEIVTHNITRENTTRKTTTQAPPAPVVVPSEKETQKPKPPEKVFAPPKKDFLKVTDTALKDIDIPEIDKMAICKRFDGPTIEKAVKAYQTQAQHIEKPTAWLIAACKGNYEPTPTKEDKETQNKAYAEKILHSLKITDRFTRISKMEITNGISNFFIASKYVDISSSSPEGNYNILYDDNKFKEKLHEALRKHRFE
jgi:hypothetical protein